MSTINPTHSGMPDRERCPAPRSSNITRSLLGYLALAGPFYVLVSLAQALTRPGFDLSRHEWSLLAAGNLGWIQSANLVLTGAMTITGSVGVWRALPVATPGRRWVSGLLALYGAAVLGAGIAPADASKGFPPGTPAGPPAHPSLHGTLHLVFGSVGFLCLIVTCFLVSRIYARQSNRRAAVASAAVGVVFLLAFVALGSGAGVTVANLAFTAAVLISYVWLTWLAVDLYRLTRRTDALAAGGR